MQRIPVFLMLLSVALTMHAAAGTANITSLSTFPQVTETPQPPRRHTFILDLTWKFNEARSKYRGRGAGDKQKARM